MAKGKSLVIVESPSKAKTIVKYLGEGYEVKASVGHIKDLPKKKLGVDVDHNFAMTQEIIPGKEKVVNELKRAAKGADRIYLAADPDREGEAICQSLYEEVAPGAQNVYRVQFFEITKNAIIEAFEHAGPINADRVKAQNTRRILDRLVGYKISPLLWKKVRMGLSAGRVQSVALRLIVEREREIRAFVQEEYWNFNAHLDAAVPPRFKAKAVKLDGKKFKVTNGEQAASLKTELEASEFRVREVKRTDKRQSPAPPYITSKLQQEGNRRYKFPARKTMQVAQKLYEGVDLGPEGSVGLITYMRTDSTRVSPVAQEAARDFILRTYGDAFYPPKTRHFAKGKAAQDAHEAIRPTDVNRTPASVKPYLSNDEYKIYNLIWQRFVASQMAEALFDHTDIRVIASRCEFQSTGDVLRFPGFLKVYQETAEEDVEVHDEENAALPPVEEGQVLSLHRLDAQQQFTQPPPRYTEATLIKALEEKGIGRPSTYAQIVTVIQNREYVVKDEGRFRPSETGEVVTDLLVESFPAFFDYQYTASMEQHLDQIEQGSQDWQEELRAFWANFAESLGRAEKEMKSLKAAVEPTDQICEACGSNLVIRWGKYGRFLSCSRYPECKTARDLSPAPATAEAAPGETPEYEPCGNCGKPMILKRGRFGAYLACTDYPACKTTRKIGKDGVPKKEDRHLEEKCPQCGHNLVEKQGRYGSFIACGGYPKCRYIRKETLGVPCPEPGCKGELAARKARGRVFYGCTNYPKCKLTVNAKPVATPCPTCGYGLMVEKETKKEGPFLECANPECKHHTPRKES